MLYERHIFSILYKKSAFLALFSITLVIRNNVRHNFNVLSHFNFLNLNKLSINCKKLHVKRLHHRTRHRKDTKTHQKLAAAEALLRPVRRDGEVRDDRRGEASACLMVTLVRAQISLRAVTGDHGTLIKLRRPDLLLALRRLADRAMLGES